MQTSVKGATYYGASIGYLFGSAVFASIIVFLDSWLSRFWLTLSLFLFVGFWVASSLKLDGRVKSRLSQIIKISAFHVLLYYTILATYGICWSLQLLEKAIVNFFIYLQADGPPVEELVTYFRLKYGFITFASAAFVAAHFQKLVDLGFGVARVAFVPSICLGLAIFAFLPRDSERRKESK